MPWNYLFVDASTLIFICRKLWTELIIIWCFIQPECKAFFFANYRYIETKINDDLSLGEVSLLAGYCELVHEM